MVGTLAAAAALALASSAARSAAHDQPADLWRLALSKRRVHRFSTLFTAQDVRDHLSTPAGLDAAVAWCQRTGVTRAFVETFRDGYQADRDALVRARDHLRGAGIEVSGCVTTTRLGKASESEWKDFGNCLTDRATWERVEPIFTFAAGLFDEIMIDDFWCTDCACAVCDAARKSRTVRLGDREYAVGSDDWAEYRLALMNRLSEECVLAPARRANARVRLIIKYPQWYDDYHKRGYDVARETAAFDRIWVGTETRDPDNAYWGRTPQYEAYFVMRWLGGIGGSKCGGGWYDPYGTSVPTYLEQARQTVLGGARESLLFCYGSLQEEAAERNVAALRAEMPALLAAAEQVRRRRPVGVAAYKPPSSPAFDEARVYDYLGMLGIPLAPCHRFPTSAPCAFFPVQALKDPGLRRKLAAYIASGRPTLLTDGLARRMEGQVDTHAPNVRILPVNGKPEQLLRLDQAAIDALRQPLLTALGLELRAPARVAVYPYTDGSWVLANFNDTPVRASVGSQDVAVPARGWTCHWR